jgi:hypothetical protein
MPFASQSFPEISVESLVPLLLQSVFVMAMLWKAPAATLEHDPRSAGVSHWP